MSTMSKRKLQPELCLFVGGSADGKRYVVNPGEPRWIVPQRQRHALWTHPDDPCQRSSIAETYHRESIFTPTREWNIYVLDGMPMDEVFERLLQYYRPEP